MGYRGSRCGRVGWDIVRWCSVVQRRYRSTRTRDCLRSGSCRGWRWRQRDSRKDIILTLVFLVIQFPINQCARLVDVLGFLLPFPIRRSFIAVLVDLGALDVLRRRCLKDATKSCIIQYNKCQEGLIHLGWDPPGLVFWKESVRLFSSMSGRKSGVFTELSEG